MEFCHSFKSRKNKVISGRHLPRHLLGTAERWPIARFHIYIWSGRLHSAARQSWDIIIQCRCHVQPISRIKYKLQLLSCMSQIPAVTPSNHIICIYYSHIIVTLLLLHDHAMSFKGTLLWEFQSLYHSQNWCVAESISFGRLYCCKKLCLWKIQFI